MRLQKLRARLGEIHAKADAIVKAAEAAKRSLTDAENTDLKSLTDEFKSIEAEIASIESVENMAGTVNATQPRITSPAQPQNEERTFGFKNFGEYVRAVKASAFGRTDPRLIQAAVTTFGGEQLGPDGGFAVPPDFRSGIMQAWESDENLARLFSPIVTNSSIVTLVTDETTPHGSGGIQGAWTDEGGTTSPTKPALKQVNITMRKVQALAHLSDELLNDAAALASYVAVKMGQKLTSLVSDAIVNGDGNGKPQGLLASPAKVSYTRTTASKVKAEDVTGMVARLRPGAFGKSFWLVHSSVLPQLWTMVLSNQAVYAMNYKDSPFGTLLGRPVYVSEYCQTLGTSGDCILVNPDGYAFAQNAAGVAQAATIGFAFDQGLNSFRASMRVGGTPLLSAAIGRKNGSDTLSDVVVIS